MLYFISIGYSQAGQVRGRLFDLSTGEPLIGATVKSESNEGSVTDLGGNFLIHARGELIRLEAEYLGFESKDTLVRVGEILDWGLSPAVTLLNTATITTGKFDKPLGEVTVSLEVIKPQLLEQNNTTSVDEVLGKISGVEVIDGQPTISWWCRVFLRCWK